MKKISKTKVLSLIFLSFMLLGWLFYRWSLSEPDISLAAITPEVIAQVKVVKLHKGEMKETLRAYGIVLPLPEKLITLSVPYISQVEKMWVNQGQIVHSNDVLLTLKSSAKTMLQWQQAKNELQAAMRANRLLQERIALKLATKQALVSSQLRVKRAQVMVQNLSEQGIGKQQHLKAEQDGIVYLVNVQQGQIIAAGAPLLQLVDQNQWVVRLGIEPGDYEHLKIGQPVFITPVNTTIANPVKGHIEIITHQIDPTTRLLNVFVRPEINQTLLINDFVEAKIIISSSQVFVLPPAIQSISYSQPH